MTVTLFREGTEPGLQTVWPIPCSALASVGSYLFLLAKQGVHNPFKIERLQFLRHF